MNKIKNTIEVPVFDGDDGIKYIRYNDMLKIIKKIKQKEDKAIELLKDTSVDMPETLLIETIDYARHILQGSDKK